MVTILETDVAIYNIPLGSDSMAFVYNSSYPGNFEWVINRNTILREDTLRLPLELKDTMLLSLRSEKSAYIFWDTLIEVGVKDPPPSPPATFKASVSPNKIFLGENIKYETDADTARVWNFNNEETSEDKTGTHNFKAEGMKTITIAIHGRDKVIKSFNVEVLPKPSVKASFSPASGNAGKSFYYSCEDLDNPRWDFNGESVSQKNKGSVVFKSPGKKTIRLYNAGNNTLLKSFTVNVTEPFSDSEISDILTKLANHGSSTSEKRTLSSKLRNYCAQQGETPVTGRENSLLDDLITKRMIESSRFVEVDIQSHSELDENGMIKEFGA
jgi:hypothetical protein